MKLKHDLGPDQEENPARKKSVGLGSIVAMIASIVSNIVPRSRCFVESLLTKMRTDQPNSGRDADEASDTCIENVLKKFSWFYPFLSNVAFCKTEC